MKILYQAFYREDSVCCWLLCLNKNALVVGLSAGDDVHLEKKASLHSDAFAVSGRMTVAWQ